MSDLTISDIGVVTSPPTTPPLTVTVQSIVDMTKRWLFTGGREQVNKLNGGVSSNAGTLVFTYALGGIQEGARVSIDLEDYRVWAVDAVTKTATVEPGQYGSTTASHLSGALAFVNAKFSQFEIVTELNNELLALSAPGGLFQVKTVDLTYNPVYRGYDLTGVSDFDGILSVRSHRIGPDKDWPVVGNWEIGRNLPTTAFSSGYALLLSDYVDPGQTVRVTYRAPFTTLANLTDDLVANAGVPASARDVVAMGTALRLSVSREIRRNFNEEQGDTRRSAEVPPGANNQAPAGLARKYEQRKGEELGRLLRAYPPRRR